MCLTNMLVKITNPSLLRFQPITLEIKKYMLANSNTILLDMRLTNLLVKITIIIC